MGVQYELLGHSRVEVPITLRGVIEGYYRGIDGLGDVGSVAQDCLHQSPVIPHDGALACGEGEGLCPPQPDL